MSIDDLHSIEIAASANRELNQQRADARFTLVINVVQALADGCSLEQVMAAVRYEPSVRSHWLPDHRSVEEQFADWIGANVAAAIKQIADGEP